MQCKFTAMSSVLVLMKAKCMRICFLLSTFTLNSISSLSCPVSLWLLYVLWNCVPLLCQVFVITALLGGQPLSAALHTVADTTQFNFHSVTAQNNWLPGHWIVQIDRLGFLVLLLYGVSHLGLSHLGSQNDVLKHRTFGIET